MEELLNALKEARKTIAYLLDPSEPPPRTDVEALIDRVLAKHATQLKREKVG